MYSNSNSISRKVLVLIIVLNIEYRAPQGQARSKQVAAAGDALLASAPMKPIRLLYTNK